MSDEIIKDSAAVLVKDADVKVLVVADLHLKDEEDNVNTIINHLKKLIKKYKPNFLVINGDVFNFGTGGKSFEVLEEEISKLVDIKIVQGNHDPELFLPCYTTKNYVFCHGDVDYELPQKNLIMAHTHPFLDNKRVFLKGTLNDGRSFLIMPPFNPDEKGPEVSYKDELLGFIFRKDMIRECLIFNLEGRKIAKLN